jgi:hypothetical protein
MPARFTFTRRSQMVAFAIFWMMSSGCAPASSDASRKATTISQNTLQHDAEVVTDVTFEDQTISDELLESWLRNPSLKRLRIAGTDIDDRELSRLVESANLELLDVSHCESLRAEGLAAISQIRTLRNLRLAGPAINDEAVRSLASLSNLAALSLQETTVTDEGLGVIESMSKLKELNLYGTPVTDASLATIAKLPELKKLRLRATKVTGSSAESFLQMVAVTDLDLSETLFTSDGMGAIGRMPQLQSLNLWLTRVDDRGVNLLGSQIQLKQLNLDNVRGITDQSLDTISMLSNLELLHLGGTSVTAAGLPKLYSLKKLKTLFITRLSLNPSDVQSVNEAMPWVENLES